MRKLSTKPKVYASLAQRSFQVCCTVFFLLLCLTSISFSQVVIRDTVTITPRTTPLKSAAVLSSTPKVEVSFYIIDGSMPAGAIIQLGIRDTTWTMYASGCSGKAGEAVGSQNFGVFPEGGYIGIVLYSNCYPGGGGAIAYDTYVSPAPGAYSYVSVYLDGIGARRTIGYFKYEKPPLPTVSITTSRNYQLAISEYNHPDIVYREEHTPGLGSPYEPTITWEPQKVIHTGQYLAAVQQNDSIDVLITVTATNTSGTATDATTLRLYKEKFLADFLVWLSKDTLSHSDTIAIYAHARDTEGKPIVIDDSTGISFYLDRNGERYGSFLGYSTTTQKWLDLVYYVDARLGKIKYVADGAIPDSATPIEIVVVKPGFHPKGGVATAVVKGGVKLDHFTVKPKKDTIAFTESSKIYVQAKDANDQDVELEADKLVKLSVTANNEYGTFINKNGDTLKTIPVQLEHVLYGDVKAGLIQFAAVKKNPTDPVLCKVLVNLESDDTKKGEREIPVVEQTLKIVMEAVREVVPRNLRGLSTPPAPTTENKKEFKVQLTRNKAAVPNHPFKLTTDYIDGTGGHDHLTPRRTRNRDNYGYLIVKRINDTTDSPYNGQTQVDGREAFDFVSSFFGDRMRLRVETTQPNKKQFLWDTLSVAEKVAGLQLLGEETNYIKVGGTDRHHGPPNLAPDNNHWATEDIITNVQAIADSFALVYNGYRLRVNDMSLPYGGGFDIFGNWDQDISQGNCSQRGHGHCGHRRGVNADISFQVIDPQNQQVALARRQRLRLLRIIRHFTGEPYPHSDHYHIQ